MSPSQSSSCTILPTYEETGPAHNLDSEASAEWISLQTFPQASGSVGGKEGTFTSDTDGIIMISSYSTVQCLPLVLGFIKSDQTHVIQSAQQGKRILYISRSILYAIRNHQH